MRVSVSGSPAIRGRLVPSEERNVEVREGQVTTDVNFHLKRGMTISGRLTYRDTGEPAGNVKVTLQGRNRMDTATDGEGRYRFEGVPPGKYWLQTDLGGYAEVPYQRPLKVVDGEDIGGADLQLVRRAAVSIQVRDSEGHPIPGAEVRYVMPDQRTDENGRCRYEEMRPERGYRMMVNHPDYAFAFIDSLVLRPGENRELTFVLSSGGILEGYITDWEGKSVARARITIGPGGSGLPLYWLQRFGREVSSDDKGYYRAEHLPEGLVRMVVHHDEPLFAPHELTVVIGGDGSLTRRDITVQRGGTMAGRVVDPEGRPVKGILRVYFMPWRYYRWKIRTDEEGYYRAEHVPAGEYEVTTSGRHWDTNREKRKVTVEDGEIVRVDFTVGNHE